MGESIRSSQARINYRGLEEGVDVEVSSFEEVDGVTEV